ncbi:MAG: hypothetical protein HY255_11220 [Betaproteobacteria bacterium]|nr:hypothetical protein [Betaproteobacteria bacterium]
MQLLLGGILGMVGQGLRVIVGLKKANDDAHQAGKDFAELFSGATLMTSLFIGFVAGVLAVISLPDMDPNCTIKDCKTLMVTLIGAGYAGTDFIEGFIKKYLPK